MTAWVVWTQVRTTGSGQRLVYGMSTVSLLRTVPGGHERIKVIWDEGKEPIQHPHVITMKVANRGRRDIANAAFNAADPVEFDLSAQILGPLDAPIGHQWEIEGSKLRLRPTIIHRGPSRWNKWKWVKVDRAKSSSAVLSITLLVDGRSPELTLTEPHPLIDVDVQKGNPDEPDLGRALTQTTMALVAALSVVLIVQLLALFNVTHY
ncbi:hypothetical protein AB0I54_46925 [Streptomyces sp. NPDC050625]|uniref:hypothetical protein n=1 Tax=Streptomyces sp. NPDC050625 TaxID=3154629 RepID=UPI003426D34F